MMQFIGFRYLEIFVVVDLRAVGSPSLLRTRPDQLCMISGLSAPVAQDPTCRLMPYPFFRLSTFLYNGS